jgi:response regulator RpfG family c-di-GMP phosphodiesterase
MKPAVLCVDDDASILEGYRRVLGGHFQLYLACGPFQGIEKLEAGPDYSVVVADMRMPDMNGIEFLKRVRARSPHTRRIMLSGDAEQSTAVDAVNLGQVSAYLAKPCPSQRLLAAVQEACADWERERLEREALRGAQTGAVSALLELLRAADPVLERRSRRIAAVSARLMEARGLSLDWQMQAAALLSQAGTLYLPAELRARIEAGEPLSVPEELALDSLPALGAAWLKPIPGFEGIAQAIALQRRGYHGQGEPLDGPLGPALPLASRVLHLAHDMDWFAGGDRSAGDLRRCLEERSERYDPDLLMAALKLGCERGGGAVELHEMAQLRPGMRFGEDLKDADGRVLARQGEAVGPALAAQLLRRAELGAVLMVDAA